MQETRELVHSDEAETRVLGCLLNYSETWHASCDRLRKELFHDHRNQRTFEVIAAIYNGGETADMIQVAMWAMQHGDTVCYNAAELAEITASVVSATLYERDLAMLEDMARRRQGWMVAQKMIQASYAMQGDMESVEKELRAFLEADTGGHRVLSMRDVNAQLRETVRQNISNPRASGVKTGFRIFDEMGGLHFSDLDVIGADSSAGKTSCALCIARNVAKEGAAVMFYSMEMQGKQLSARINAAASGISAGRLLYKGLDTGQIEMLEAAFRMTDGLPIYFDEESCSTSQSIMASIRVNVKRLGVKVVFVDYLQILSSTEKVKNEESFFGQVARDFKNLAKKLDVCIVLLSQLRRDNLDPRPTLARLRASGQIGEAADNVMLIYRPSVYKKHFEGYKDGAFDETKYAEFILAKGRNLGLQSVIVGFRPETTEFFDCSDPRFNDAAAEPQPTGVIKGEQNTAAQDQSLPF